MRASISGFFPPLVLLALSVGAAQAEEMTPVKPSTTEAASSIRYFTRNKQQGVETISRAYEVTDDHMPGHAGDDGRIVLRSEIRDKAMIGDEGSDSHVKIEAWRIGGDFAVKPLYTIAVTGSSFSHFDNLLIVERGTGGDSIWQSVYRTGTGRHLFDVSGAYASFKIRENSDRWALRIAGLYLVTDEETDPDLKKPGTVGLLGYAASEDDPGTVHRLMLTADDPKQAIALRAFWTGEEEWNIAVEPVFGTASAEPGTATLVLTMFGGAKARLSIPILKDDFDLDHAELPAGLHLARWKP